MTYVTFFDQPAAATALGGKGANLAALACARFPVPPGFVVTADAYRVFVDQLGWLEGDVAALDYAHPDRLHEQCAGLRRRLLQEPLPAVVGHDIRAALDHPALAGGVD